MYFYIVRDINTLDVLFTCSESDYRKGRLTPKLRELQSQGRSFEVIKEKNLDPQIQKERVNWRNYYEIL